MWCIQGCFVDIDTVSDNANSLIRIKPLKHGDEVDVGIG